MKNELTEGKTHYKPYQAVQIPVSEGTVDLCVFLDSYVCLTVYTKHNATSKTKRHLVPNDVDATASTINQSKRGSLYRLH